MAKESCGVYIHIPFCLSKCHYCDFCSFPRASEEKKIAYFAQLKKEVSSFAQTHRERIVVDSVYFGGGTPTCCSPKLLADLLAHIRAALSVTDHAEISVECNPKTANTDSFRALRSAGFNRLSIGMQSAQENELRALGRIHRHVDTVQTVCDARAAGFNNISLDLMLGIPEQTRDSFHATLEEALALSPEHLSIYCLKIEDGTRFAALADTLPFPQEDVVCDLYEEMIPWLSDRGLFQYEISNFAKKGFASRHNLKYWRRMPYIGFGVAAHSDIDGERIAHSRDFDAYLRGEDVTEDRRPISRREAENEYMMLGLRLCQGVDESVFAENFGKTFDEFFGDRLKPYLDAGLAKKQGERLFLTPRGMLLSNTILADLLDFQENPIDN